MRVSLVLCPAWSLSGPPHGLALLKGALAAEGVECSCHDLNLAFYRSIRRDPALRESWAWSEIGRIWGGDPRFAEGLLATHDGFLRRYVDEVLRGRPEIVGLSVNAMNRTWTRRFVDLVREADPKVLVAIGGPELSSDPPESLLKTFGADAVCVGRGEESFPAFARRVGAGDRASFGNVRTLLPPRPAADVSDVRAGARYCDYSDFNFSDYLQARLTIEFSRGCVNACLFCDEDRTRPYHWRDPRDVVAELRHQLTSNRSVAGVEFSDAMINGDRRALEELADRMIAEAIPSCWGGQAAIRPGMDSGLLLKLRKAGCLWLSYGVESGSDRILKRMRKPFDVRSAREAIERTHDAGIAVYFNLVVGFPGEEREDLEKTLDLVRRIGPRAKLIHIAPLRLSREMLKDPGGWGIGLGSADPARWRSADGSNTPQERSRRMRLVAAATTQAGATALTLDEV